MTPGPRVSLRVIFAIGTSFALVAAVVSYGFTRMTGRSLWTLQPDASAVASYVFLMNLVVWNGWAALAPGVLWLARRFRFDRLTWRKALVVHVAAAFIFPLVHVVLVGTGRYWLQSLWGLVVVWSEVVQEAFFRMFDWEITCYCAIVGLSHALDYYSEARDRELRAAQLETRLIEAQLEALQRQLHPHFLFNTLHAISAFVRRDPEAAQRMIERLSDLLRLTLQKATQQEIPLKEELEYLAAYLDIEQVHFGERLRVIHEIASETLDALVPTLILQPLVENALRHGIAPHRGAGCLEVRAKRVGPSLVVTVRDDGAHAPRRKATDTAAGIGLANTRARLERLYGDRHRMNCSAGPGGGFVVEISIPFRTGMHDRIEATNSEHAQPPDRTYATSHMRP